MFKSFHCHALNTNVGPNNKAVNGIVLILYLMHTQLTYIVASTLKMQQPGAVLHKYTHVLPLVSTYKYSRPSLIQTDLYQGHSKSVWISEFVPISKIVGMVANSACVP